MTPCMLTVLHPSENAVILDDSIYHKIHFCGSCWNVVEKRNNAQYETNNYYIEEFLSLFFFLLSLILESSFRPSTFSLSNIDEAHGLKFHLEL